MQITEIVRKRTGLSSGRSSTSRKFIEVYQVTFDSVTGQEALRQAAYMAETGQGYTGGDTGVLIPQIGDQFPFDQLRYCTDITAKVSGSSQTTDVWDVTVAFTTPGSENPEQGEGNPADEIGQISFDGQNVTEEVDTDANDKAIHNSVQQTKILTKEYADFGVNVSKNIAGEQLTSTMWENMAKFSNTVNSDTFLFPGDEKKWKLDPIRGTRHVHPTFGVYYTFDVRAIFREQIKDDRTGVFHSGWETRFVNDGTLERKEDPDQPGIFDFFPIEVDGVPITTPVPLQAFGDTILRLKPDEDPVYRFAELYKAQPWGTWLWNDLGVFA
jgi:hypothetical protein